MTDPETQPLGLQGNPNDRVKCTSCGKSLRTGPEFKVNMCKDCQERARNEQVEMKAKSK